jgi:CHAT domain-containing protein
MSTGRAAAATLIAASMLSAVGAQAASAQDLPPKTIADILALLEQEKPDSARLAKLRAETDAEPPARASPSDLIEFYYRRSEARQVAGRLAEARADAEKGLSIDRSTVEPKLVLDVRGHAAWLYRNAGQPQKCVQAFKEIERDTDRPGFKGRLFGVYKNMGNCLLSMGDLAQTEAYVAKAGALLREARGWNNFGIYGTTWEGNVRELAGFFYRAKGQFKEAEQNFQRAEQLARQSALTYHMWERRPPRSRVEYLPDYLALLTGRVKAAQGRLVEAEVDIRRALIAQLKAQGSYNPATPLLLNALGQTLADQGRHVEAEQLTRIAIRIYRDLKYAPDSNNLVGGLHNLASLLNLQGRWPEAAAVYRELDEATQSWDKRRKDNLEMNASRVYMLYNTGNLAEGLEAANAYFARIAARFGEGHINTALARGAVAIGLARTGKTDEAVAEFKKSIEVLLSATFDSDEEDASVSTAAQARIRDVVEAYMGVLAAQRSGDATAVAEAFRLGEAVRGSSVQKAVVAASVRMAVNNPTVGELARKDQELERQRAALLALLNNLLGMPPEERDDKVVAELRKQIDTLRAQRSASRKELEKRFPRYADLINPKPPRVEDVRASLKPGEVFVSFFFGRFRSFVWAIPKEGAVAFAGLRTTLDQIDDRVSRIRASLEGTDIQKLTDIPQFNFDIAHGLYNLLLKPVEGSWRGAKTLVVASNGALGLLPLGLLTSEAFIPATDEQLYFASYRKAPWLARTHAVTFVPSAASLITLRGLAASSPQRDRLIGFGDPYFSKEQAREAGEKAKLENPNSINQRGVHIARRSLPKLGGFNTAQLDRLPRLPDTADELRSVALALQVDPAKVLKLGKDANERAVKQANLAKFRVVAFATHGLVPGELDGLSQPALALSAPDVADVDGDGLLTMDEVLALNLDADWVVLSACNTASGVRAGAEAASGLGRAFFYAGARSLLLTNWAVYSVPAAQLVSDLFRRQAGDAKLPRAEALRQAMMALIDGPGFRDDADNKEVVTFAHPVFWAPYTVVGDGSAE